MIARLEYKPGQRHQFIAMGCLSRGLAEHGLKCELAPTGSMAPADFVVTWGDRNDYDIPQLVLEAGYINGQSGNYVQDRLRFVSTGWNGLHGRADAVRSDCPPGRWEALGITLRDWRNDLGYILVCDQHPGDICAPTQGWWDEFDVDERVVYRPHPLLADKEMRPLSEALKGARCCITWNSTCAVEAVIAGVPTWALDRGSIAYPVAAHAFNDYAFLGDRRQWAYNLAYRQWTHDELTSGEAWEHLRHGLTDN